MQRGEVLRVDFPKQEGHEQQGRRPAIVVVAGQITANVGLFICVPLTSELKYLKWPFTFQINQSAQNGLDSPSVALVYQLRSTDQIRVLDKWGQLEAHYLEQLNDTLRKMLGL